MKKKSNAGRPTKMDDITVKKLEDAFIDGCGDLEACFRAGITKPTLYKYQKEHNGYIDRKEALKTCPTSTARRTVAKAAKTDVNVAMYLLNKADGKPMQQVRLDKDSEITVNVKSYKGDK